MNKLIGITIALVIGLATASYANASYGTPYGNGCETIYGGGETCVKTPEFMLDKKVMHPHTGKGETENFVDNLSANDAKYLPDQTIKFELRLTNTGDSVLKEVVLTDILPSYVTYVSGPGSYDSNSRTLTINIADLNPDQSKRYVIEGTIVSSDNLPVGQGVVCAVNQSSAKSNENESHDNSQFCIEVGTDGHVVMPAPPIEETPDTGAGLGLIALIPAAIGGMILRRKSK